MLPIELTSQRVFYYFQQLSNIPRGSGNMVAIADYCQNFAKEHNLKYVRDTANNVIIYKNATATYENAQPVILQGHLDMVCQKNPDCTIDFDNDGLSLYVDGDFIKAQGTTLGADNGIAAAMMLSILEDTSIAHPPIEAVFTTDEEVGMIGARALDMSVLSGKRMINLDSDADGIVTVSCAGGSDFVAKMPLNKVQVKATMVTIDINGLKGGHSGVEINKNRINANIIAGRILSCITNYKNFNVISINGGDKANAIPNRCIIKLCVDDGKAFCDYVKKFIDVIKDEISDREGNFNVDLIIGETKEFWAFDNATQDKITKILLCVPNGVTEMSAEIDNLVQTSLNLGILATGEQDVLLHFALRSNKLTALMFLQDRICAFFDAFGLTQETFGHYPPWEYREISPLRDTYCSLYYKKFNKQPTIKAIHAGLECGVFASQINDFDCIAIGPALYDIHTTRERLSISSTNEFFALLLNTLKELN